MVSDMNTVHPDRGEEGPGIWSLLSRWIPILLLTGVIGFFVFSRMEQVPFVERRQVLEIDFDQEANIGRQTFEEVVRRSSVVNSGPAVTRVQLVRNRLRDAVGELDPGFTWNVVVIDSNQIDMISVPGGSMAVTTGMLDVLRNDDQLAVLMGRELGHALARHATERLSQRGATGFASADLNTLDTTVRRDILATIGVADNRALSLPYSAAHDKEADYIGLMLAARACYDPTAALEVWRNLEDYEATRGQVAYLQLHPIRVERERYVQDSLPAAREERQSANCT